MKKRLAALVLGLILVGSAAVSPQPVQGATIYTKDNGIIKLLLNESSWPMITRMYILGTEMIPNYGVGADFQMAVRSTDFGSNGNAYNPTQGGDCLGQGSILTGVIPNWTNSPPLPAGIPSSNGILLGVTPRLYGETSLGSCSAQPGNADVAPYNFNFGVVLGDDTHLPKQMIVLDLDVQRKDSTAPSLIKWASDLPSAFFNSSQMHYAYYSVDGYNFSKLLYNNTNDVKQWPNAVNVSPSVNPNGRVIMISNVPDSDTNINNGTGIAFYSNFTTALYASHRVAVPDLSLISLGGDVFFGSATINDLSWHVARRVVAVGNLNTIRIVIGSAQNKISDWGNW